LQAAAATKFVDTTCHYLRPYDNELQQLMVQLMVPLWATDVTKFISINYMCACNVRIIMIAIATY